MLVCPRWEKVRLLGPGGVGPPLLLNRFKGHRLYACAQRAYVHRVTAFERQWVEREHANTPEIRGGTGWLDSQQINGIALFGSGDVGTVGAGTNITYSVTGNQCGGRYLPHANLTLNSLYFFCVTTNASNTVQYNGSAGTNSLPTTPGTPTLFGPTNATTAMGTWTAVSGLSSALTGGTTYWFWTSDSSATSPVIRKHLTGGFSQRPNWHFAMFDGASTTDAWAAAANRSFSGALATMVLGFSDGSARGFPFTAVTNATNTTNEKGLYIPAPTASFKLFGALFGGTFSNNVTGLNVYTGNTTPSGTGDVGRTTNAVDGEATTQAHAGFVFATPVTLATGSGYHITFTFSAAATTSVQKMSIGTGIDATLRKAMFFGGAGGYAESNGTTNWTNDDADTPGGTYNSWPIMMLEIEDLVAAAGGASLLVHPGMTGGMRG